jgi:prepilin-type N-terminal cleavage/methylation domain-containing protein
VIRRQDGMTLVEILVTILVLSIGTLATLGSFTAFSAAARDSQVRAVLVSVGQQQIEALRPVAYAQLALTGPPPAQAAVEAARTSPASGEPLVSGGVVDPGPDSFTYQGISGRIYRYVTWRAQACPAVTAKVQTQLATDLGSTSAAVAAALPDLCPGTTHTKRLTVVVVPVVAGKAGVPVRLSTIATDPAAALPVTATAGLQLQPVVQAVAGGAGAPVPTVTQQAFQLTDTRCDASVRATPADHATHSSALASAACTTGVSGRPDLMTLAPIPGAAGDPVRDFSTDVTRTAAGGLAMTRDDRAGSCTAASALDYTAAESAQRRYSLHSWATPPAAALFQTPASGGRAVVSLWTRTADGGSHPGRLCVVLRRMSTGAVLGYADFALTRWPTEATELSLGFDLGGATLAAGERLLVSLRVPKDSGADLDLLYDHAAYQSRVTLTTTTGKEFQ